MKKLAVKHIKIETGGPLIGLLHKDDAEFFDLHNGDRVKLINGRKSIVVKIDISDRKEFLSPGVMGLFHESFAKLSPKKGEKFSIVPVPKPLSVRFIRDKLDGKTLNKEQIHQIIRDVVNNEIDDIELAYFVAGTHTTRMTREETVNLTKSMVQHGDILRFRRKMVVDKHCIGGVAGNRTTMILVPIVAEAGLIIPKTSSRSITSPAGTADTMECIASVSFPMEKIKSVVRKTNGCIVWGGSLNLAPADDRIIRVEHPLDLDSQPQLIASILAKKASVSATRVVIDIPVGEEAKVASEEEANKLKREFEIIGKEVGMRIKAVITDGSSPIGRGFGPALEARDVLAVLRNEDYAPKDLREKSLMLAGILLEMTGKAEKGQGKKMAEEILSSGRAFRKFEEIAREQGLVTLNPEEIKLGRHRKSISSPKRGNVRAIRNLAVSRIARIAGAPRDKGAGILLHVDRKSVV